jgi:hypothetical protein
MLRDQVRHLANCCGAYLVGSSTLNRAAIGAHCGAGCCSRFAAGRVASERRGFVARAGPVCGVEVFRRLRRREEVETGKGSGDLGNKAQRRFRAVLAR